LHRSALDKAILASAPSLTGMTAFAWKSPLVEGNHYEYRDDFLDALGLRAHTAALREFWPAGGPQWDGLAAVLGAREGVLLVEAKAHPAETASKCKAGPESLQQIQRAFRMVQDAAGFPNSDWTRDEVYQLANRIAYLWFLNEKLGIPTWLALVLFVNDRSYRPTTRAQWEPHIAHLLGQLGTAGSRIADRISVVYVDA
jgi:hypothetical protein